MARHCARAPVAPTHPGGSGAAPAHSGGRCAFALGLGSRFRSMMPGRLSDPSPQEEPMRFRIAAVALLVITSLSALASRPHAYPGGTPIFVTNAAPYCAGCHSSVNAQQLREMPAEKSAGMIPENKH